MKKITLLFVLCFVVALQLEAQVVHTIFGSSGNGADTQWSDPGATFSVFAPVEQPDNGKLQTRCCVLANSTYTGTYSGTVSSTDVIYLKIRRISVEATPIEDFIVSYKQNGGATETSTLKLPLTTVVEEIKITPGFTDGATLSELEFTMAQGDGTSVAFDVFRAHEFVIGPDPTLSIKSNVIEGAIVLAKEGAITVKGADLEAVYALTGQEVKATNLSSGIYIVKISKGDKAATLKVVLSN